MSDNLISREFFRNIIEGMLADSEAHDRAVFGPEEYRRKGHSVTREYSPEWIAQRDTFARKFEAMVNDGLKRGFLKHGHCYECGGELEVTTDTSETDWVYDETKAEWEARVADLPEITLLHGHKIGGTRDRTQ